MGNLFAPSTPFAMVVQEHAEVSAVGSGSVVSHAGEAGTHGAALGGVCLGKGPVSWAVRSEGSQSVALGVAHVKDSKRPRRKNSVAPHVTMAGTYGWCEVCLAWAVAPRPHSAPLRSGPVRPFPRQGYTWSNGKCLQQQEVKTAGEGELLQFRLSAWVPGGKGRTLTCEVASKYKARNSMQVPGNGELFIFVGLSSGKATVIPPPGYKPPEGFARCW